MLIIGIIIGAIVFAIVIGVILYMYLKKAPDPGIDPQCPADMPNLYSGGCYSCPSNCDAFNGKCIVTCKTGPGLTFSNGVCLKNIVQSPLYNSPLVDIKDTDPCPPGYTRFNGKCYMTCPGRINEQTCTIGGKAVSNPRFALNVSKVCQGGSVINDKCYGPCPVGYYRINFGPNKGGCTNSSCGPYGDELPDRDDQCSMKIEKPLKSGQLSAVGICPAGFVMREGRCYKS